MTIKCRCTGARQRGVRATCHATEPAGMPDFTKTTSTPPIRCTWSTCFSAGTGCQETYLWSFYIHQRLRPLLRIQA
jgi:hypothetical protein